MKNIIALAILLTLSISSFGQAQASYKIGDTELETDLKKIKANASVNFGDFKVKVAGTYNVEERKIEHMKAELGMDEAEIYLALEMGKVTKKSIDEVIEVYTVHKDKGWGHIAKQLGIKPGSAEFHALKNGTRNSAYVTDSSPGKGKSKDKGKSKGKGKNK